MADQKRVQDETVNSNVITEAGITIGWNKDGQLIFTLHGGCNPASAVVLLERAKLEFIGKIDFTHTTHSGLVVAPSGALNRLNGKH